MIKVKKSEDRLNRSLETAIKTKNFDFDGFINEISKINPEMVSTAVGRSFLIKSLNAAAKEAWHDGLFYQENMLSEIVSRIPSVTEDIAAKYCCRETVAINGNIMLVDYYDERKFDPSKKHAADRANMREEREKEQREQELREAMDHAAEKQI